MNLKPSEIFYSQDSINNVFDKKCNHRYKLIGETLDAICEGRCSVENIPTISVVETYGKWVTEDNRRLWVFKQLERHGKCEKISVRKGYFIPTRKRTSNNGGVSVRVRGSPGGNWYLKSSLVKDLNDDKNINIQRDKDYRETQEFQEVDIDISNILSSNRDSHEFSEQSRKVTNSNYEKHGHFGSSIGASSYRNTMGVNSTFDESQDFSSDREMMLEKVSIAIPVSQKDSCQSGGKDRDRSKVLRATPMSEKVRLSIPKLSPMSITFDESQDFSSDLETMLEKVSIAIPVSQKDSCQSGGKDRDESKILRATPMFEKVRLSIPKSSPMSITFDESLDFSSDLETMLEKVSIAIPVTQKDSCKSGGKDRDESKILRATPMSEKVRLSIPKSSPMSITLRSSVSHLKQEIDSVNSSVSQKIVTPNAVSSAGSQEGRLSSIRSLSHLQPRSMYYTGSSSALQRRSTSYTGSSSALQPRSMYYTGSLSALQQRSMYYRGSISTLQRRSTSYTGSSSALHPRSMYYAWS